MKTIIEILYDSFGWQRKDTIEKVASEIEANYYPKKFVHYFLTKVYFRFGDEKFWITENNQYYGTLDELYEFWKILKK